MALVLCTGLVIDDSIVMLENIHKKVGKGESKFQASINGSKEVLFAILSTSVVLISIFMPIIFLEGDTAKLFLELSITIISAVFFSTVISITLTPMLCSKILNHSKQKKQSKPFLEFYLKLLKFLLQNKFIYVLIIIPMIFFSYHLYKKISKEFAPQEDRGVFIMVMESPEGSTFENTVNQMLKLEEKLIDLNENNEAKRILLRVPRSFQAQKTLVMV